MDEVKKSFFTTVKTFVPDHLNVWIIVLTCLVVIIALSRLMNLQKTVSELSSRPAVDEHLVRQIVRQHLEETVKAMDQQNRLQIQMRQQQLEAMRRAVPPPPPASIEIVEEKKEEVPLPPAPAPEPIPTPTPPPPPSVTPPTLPSAPPVMLPETAEVQSLPEIEEEEPRKRRSKKRESVRV